MAFEGWNDAGDSATTAADHIVDKLGAEVFATLDPEPFYDFTNTRPTVRLNADGKREISWPTNDFASAVLPDSDRDIIILTGTEPQLRWRTYCEAVVKLAAEHDVSLVVSLGALIADVVHTRPTTIYGASYDPALCEELDLEPSGYEGPTGIVGVIHDAFNQAQMGSVSLWGTVPSYVPHAPSPKAAMALVNRVAKLVDIEIPVTSLESSSQVYEKQITDLVSDDLETQEYVADLEARYDEAIGPGSGEALISELEEFLRDQS
jgi:proteasome assembly chaperone (PAC2) family protein